MKTLEDTIMEGMTVSFSFNEDGSNGGQHAGASGWYTFSYDGISIRLYSTTTTHRLRKIATDAILTIITNPNFR